MIEQEHLALLYDQEGLLVVQGVLLSLRLMRIVVCMRKGAQNAWPDWSSVANSCSVVMMQVVWIVLLRSASGPCTETDSPALLQVLTQYATCRLVDCREFMSPIALPVPIHRVRMCFSLYCLCMPQQQEEPLASC